MVGIEASVYSGVSAPRALQELPKELTWLTGQILRDPSVRASLHSLHGSLYFGMNQDAVTGADQRFTCHVVLPNGDNAEFGFEHLPRDARLLVASRVGGVTSKLATADPGVFVVEKTEAGDDSVTTRSLGSTSLIQLADVITPSAVSAATSHDDFVSASGPIETPRGKAGFMLPRETATALFGRFCSAVFEEIFSGSVQSQNRRLAVVARINLDVSTRVRSYGEAPRNIVDIQAFNREDWRTGILRVLLPQLYYRPEGLDDEKRSILPAEEPAGVECVAGYVVSGQGLEMAEFWDCSQEGQMVSARTVQPKIPDEIQTRYDAPLAAGVLDHPVYLVRSFMRFMDEGFPQQRPISA